MFCRDVFQNLLQQNRIKRQRKFFVNDKTKRQILSLLLHTNVRLDNRDAMPKMIRHHGYTIYKTWRFSQLFDFESRAQTRPSNPFTFKLADVRVPRIFLGLSRSNEMRYRNKRTLAVWLTAKSINYAFIRNKSMIIRLRVNEWLLCVWLILPVLSASWWRWAIIYFIRPHWDWRTRICYIITRQACRSQWRTWSTLWFAARSLPEQIPLQFGNRGENNLRKNWHFWVQNE